MGVNNSIEIKAVRTAPDLASFIRLQRSINAGEERWIPPLYAQEEKNLDRHKNPFYEHAEAGFFLALKDGRPAGRIAAIENSLHNIYYGDKVGFFGYYEAVDDDDVGRALFDAAEKWLKERGLAFMRGPVNPSMNGNIGFLVDGFDWPPSMLMPYTKRYYIDHARASGLDKAMDVIVYGWFFHVYDSVDQGVRFLKQLERLERFINKKNKITVRRINLDDVEGEIAIIKEICNQSLKDNWGYVPLTDGEMEALKHELLRIVDPDFFYIAEIDGTPEAVFMALPDYNKILARMNGRIFPFGWLKFLLFKKKIDKLILYLFAATPKGEQIGIAAPMYAEFFRECFKRKIKNYETGYVLENNLRLCNMLDKFHATKRKRYRIFQKPI